MLSRIDGWLRRGESPLEVQRVTLPGQVFELLSNRPPIEQWQKDFAREGIEIRLIRPGAKTLRFISGNPRWESLERKFDQALIALGINPPAIKAITYQRGSAHVATWLIAQHSSSFPDQMQGVMGPNGEPIRRVWEVACNENGMPVLTQHMWWVEREIGDEGFIPTDRAIHTVQTFCLAEANIEVKVTRGKRQRVLETTVAAGRPPSPVRPSPLKQACFQRPSELDIQLPPKALDFNGDHRLDVSGLGEQVEGDRALDMSTDIGHVLC